ncbi:phosphotransferase [Streptomyces scabiei]|uniref:phosphotransferase n=1 Tax=Streptomyces scabiei TaxID=1930 RepID=UPI0038F6884A
MNDASAASIPLTGGRMGSEVTRDGSTVRKRATAASPFMARLLRLLEDGGFSEAPKYLGQMDGLDILSFIEGVVPARFRPWSDDQVSAAASLLRRMHDATRGSDLADRFDVVCHHDPGPNNYVFRHDVPIALIDFYEAAPGSRLEDVGYMAFTWSISSKQGIPLEHQARQVRLIADAYGLLEAERLALVDAVLERQFRNVRFWTDYLARPDEAPADPEVLIDRIAWSRQESAFTIRHRATFDDALA